MKKLSSRILALSLSLVMFMTLMPTMSFAASESTSGYTTYSATLTSKPEDQLVVLYKQPSTNKMQSRAASANVESVKRTSAFVDVVQPVAGADSEALMQELRNNPDVESVGYNRVYKTTAMPNDEYLNEANPNYAWHFKSTGAHLTWDKVSGTATVAVLDSGVKTTHPDLKNRLSTGFDYVTNSANVDDVFGHGTSVAGVLVASANNSIGIAGIAGNANIKIAPYRVGGITPNDNNIYDDMIIAALTEITNYRSDVSVINMSFGYSIPELITSDNSPLFVAIKKAYSAGKTIVAAAGNDGTAMYSYPASYDYVMSVASIDSDETQSSFSHYNSRIDIAAPGGRILSTDKNGSYSYKNGTSLSSPLVAGAAAVVKLKNPSFSNTSIVAKLKETAVKPKNDIYDKNKYGSGILKLNRALGFPDNSVPITSITPKPSSVGIYLGEGVKIQVAYQPSTATNTVFTYTSANPNIATVDNAGNIKGVGFGETKITVKTTDGSNLSSDVTVYIVPRVAIKSLTLNPNTQGVYLNESVKINPVIAPSNASHKVLTYTSADSSVATVDKNGTLKAVGFGSTKITVKTTDGSNLSAEFTVTCVPRVPVSSLTLNPNSQGIYLNETAKINPVIAPSNASYKSVTYTSADPSIATVDKNGVVKAITEGSTKITVKTVDGTNKEAIFNVYTASRNPVQKITSIVASPNSQGIYLNETTKINTVIAPANASNKTLTYTSNNPSVATVDKNGVVKAVSLGETTITIKTTDGSQKEATFSVYTASRNPAQKITSIVANPSSQGIYLNEKVKINAVVAPANASNKTLTYTSNNPKIATVDNNGVVTAVSIGETTITIKATDGSNKEATFSVYTASRNPVLITSIVANPDTQGIYLNESAKINVDIAPLNASNKTLTFVSNNPSVATVDKNGVVTGVGIGSTTITIKTNDGSQKEAIFNTYIVRR